MAKPSMAKPRRKKKGGVSWWLLILGLVIGAASVIIFFYYRGPERPPVQTRMPPPVVTPPAGPRVPPAPPVVETPVLPPHKPPSKPHSLARLVIVIDDMGQEMKKLDELFKAGVPITIAVLPHLPYSVQTATEAHSFGWDVLLHLPMEPKGSDEHDPGKGALWTAMTSAEVRDQTEADLKDVPFAVGLNNHMGSRFTEDGPLMREVLKVAKKRGLYFLDSRTTPRSVAARTARELGVPSAGRDVFLDNERDVSRIKARIAEAVKIAKRRGYAIAIGHPYPETITALQESAGGLVGRGVEVVRLSEIVK